MESLSDIVAQMRGRGEDGRMDRRLWLDYADRIEAAAKRDERLMLSLMLYAVEDYVEDWAGRNYKSCVQSACERLGIEYHSSARQLWEQIEEKIKRMEGSANEKPE